HSSLAIVLLTTTLFVAGVIPLEMGMLMVLGANIGGTVPPIIATVNGSVAGKRVAIGNALFKLSLCLLMLPFLGNVPHVFGGLLETSGALVNFHMGVNLAVALMFLPWVGLFARLFERMIPESGHPDDGLATRYLDRDLLDSP